MRLEFGRRIRDRKDVLSHFTLHNGVMKKVKPVVCLFFLSMLVVFGLNWLLNNNPMPEFLIADGFYSPNPENTRYILSALAQAQAAIFGIFFTLNFIIAQLQLQNKAASPYSMRKLLDSNIFKFIFLTFLISINIDLLLIRYIGLVKINIFWVLVLSIFATLLLFSYMRTNILYLFNTFVLEDIRRKVPRHDLTGAELSWAPLKGVYFELNTPQLAAVGMVKKTT